MLLLAGSLACLVALQAPPPAGGAPDEPRGLRLSAPGAFGGYTFFGPLASKTTWLVDMEGREVHRWESELAPSAVHLLDDGSILRCARLEGHEIFAGGGICGRIERIGWDGEVLWRYDLASADQTTHHDALALPNGNVLVIVWEFRYREDCIAAGRDPAKVSDKAGLWPDAVLEIAPTPPEGGEIVWEWHVWDHLVQDRDPALDHYGKIADHPELIDVNYDLREAAPLSDEERKKQAELEAEMQALGYAGGAEEDDAPAPPTGAAGTALLPQQTGNGSDWLHTNAIDYNPELDLIALSSPNLSEVWIIDHSTTTDQAAGHTGGRYKKGGDILWRWGNPKNHGAGTDADRKLFFQHNVQWIPPGSPGAGHLLVFNNGQQRADGEYSSVDELSLPFEPGKGFTRTGLAFGPAAPVWSYTDKGTFFSPFISGCQRLPNGNTLICEGPKGRIFEVTSTGTIVWEFWNPFGGDLKAEGVDGKALFRAYRFGPDHPGLKGRKLAPVAKQ